MSLHPLDPFPVGWYEAMLSDELPRGAVRPLKALGRDFVVWRAEDGGAHVMDAFCAHLGAHLGHGGKVEGRTIRCPFHAWRYDGTGACVEIPYSAKNHKLARMRSFPARVINGMLMFWWDRDGGEPRWEPEAIPEWDDPAWSDGYVRRHEWTIRTRWREIGENGVDMTHFYYLHGVAALPTLESYETDGHVWRSIIGHRFRSPRGERPGSFELTYTGPGQGWQRFTIEDVAEVVFAISIVPIDDESVHLRFSFLTQRESRWPGQARAEAALIQEIIDQVSDDVPIWENKIIKDPPRLARGDGPIMAFRKWGRQFSAATAGDSQEALEPAAAIAAD